MIKDKNLIINKRTFDTSFYEMELEFDNSKVLDFLKEKIMFQDTMLTTYNEFKNILEDEKLLKFKNHIYEHLHYFSKNVLKNKQVVMGESWFQAYKENDYHSLHIHGIDKNWWSLIYYVEASVNSAKTIIYSPGYPYAPEVKKIVEPKKNKLVIFPSYFPHQVELNKDNSRIILSANFKVY